MEETILYAHHVGGRGGTVSFPELPHFSDGICNVIYDADESCLEEINKLSSINSKVFSACLFDRRRSIELNLNYCPYTSSVFPFNNEYSSYYEEKRLNYSDYLFGKSFSCVKKVPTFCETIDDLFDEGKIPQVDFLSIDAQGAELPILRGGSRMLANRTVAVYCEVNFSDIYVGAPLFGELDAFLRGKGFLLAGLWPMQFGYARIPRKFRGLGIPLQGEALYLLKPECVCNIDGIERKTRLENLAFCSLAFGFTEVAYQASKLSQGNECVSDGKIQSFLKAFCTEIDNCPDLPPLWHDSLPANGGNAVSMVGDRSLATYSRPLRLFHRFKANPKLFFREVEVYFSNKMIRALSFFGAHSLGFNQFETFLADYGFKKAAKDVFKRRIR